MAVIVARQIFTGPTLIGERDAPNGVAGKRYRVQLDLDPADLVNPAKWVELVLQQRASASDPWRDNGGCLYQGGTYFKRDGVTPADLPGFQIDGEEIAGQRVALIVTPGHGVLNGRILYSVGDTINTGVLASVI